MNWIDDLKKEYGDYSEQLKTERDEIKVKLHLLSMDIQDEWHELEKKYEHFTQKVDRIEEAAGESAEEVGSALKLVVEELQSGYQRIKSRI